MGIKVTSLGVLKKRTHGYWQCFIPCICSTGHPGHVKLRTTSRNCPSNLLVWMEGDWCGFSWYKLVCEDGARAARRREVSFKSKSKSMPQMVENVLDLFQKILEKNIWVCHSAFNQSQPLCFTSTESRVKNIQSSTGPWVFNSVANNWGNWLPIPGAALCLLYWWSSHEDFNIINY